MKPDPRTSNRCMTIAAGQRSRRRFAIGRFSGVEFCMSVYLRRNETGARARPRPIAVSGVLPPRRRDRLPAGIAVKATLFELLANATVEQALVRILRHCLAHLRANEPVLLETDEPGGVHQIRVALRRMRSAFRLFRPYLSGARYRALGGEMKWLTARLEAAREWDVLRHQIVEPVMTATEGGEEGFDALLSRIDNARHEARRAARDAVRSPRYRRFLADMDGWIAHRAWRDVVPDGSPFDASMAVLLWVLSRPAPQSRLRTPAPSTRRQHG